MWLQGVKACSRGFSAHLYGTLQPGWTAESVLTVSSEPRQSEATVKFIKWGARREYTEYTLLVVKRMASRVMHVDPGCFLATQLE